MPVPQLPDFEQTLALADGQLYASELAECHGADCALLCRHPASTTDAFISLLNALELVKQPGQSLLGALSSLHEATAGQLADDQLRVSVWLPGDDEPLEDRTEALGHWCSGFLAGLASGNELSPEALSEDVSGALTDLAQIAQAEISGDGDSDEEESALMEIVEYVRMVIFMMRDELSPPMPEDRLH